MSKKAQVYEIPITYFCISVIVLMDMTSSLQDKGTFLLVLDARTYEELGRANVPVNMAYGFHGTFDASD